MNFLYFHLSYNVCMYMYAPSDMDRVGVEQVVYACACEPVWKEEDQWPRDRLLSETRHGWVGWFELDTEWIGDTGMRMSWWFDVAIGVVSGWNVKTEKRWIQGYVRWGELVGRSVKVGRYIPISNEIYWNKSKTARLDLTSCMASTARTIHGRETHEATLQEREPTTVTKPTLFECR